MKLFQHVAPIDHDLPCPECGYNLRGLPANRRCPECGTVVGAVGGPPSSLRRPLIDVITGRGRFDRARWTTALGLASGVLIIVVIARLVLYITPQGPVLQAQLYLGLGFVLSLIWIYAAAQMLTRQLTHAWPWMKPWRVAVLITQALWPIAYLFWWWDAVMGGPTIAAVAQLALRFLAATGFVIFMQILRFIAEEAQLDTAARRLNAGSWFVIPTTFVVWWMSGDVSIVELIVLAPMFILWTWPMTLMVLGLLEMRGHAKWADRHEELSIGRAERVAAKRREYEAQSAAKVRPIAATGSTSASASNAVSADVAVAPFNETTSIAPGDGDITLE